MVAVNKLQLAPPYAVSQCMENLGSNLRTARLRRRWTAADVAERIGTGPRAVLDAEKGKATTSLVVYTALLWLYNLLPQFAQVADPLLDKEGLVLESSRQPQRARRTKGLDNDF